MTMNRCCWSTLAMLLFLAPGRGWAEQELTAHTVAQAPAIDGHPDPVWEKAPEIVTRDQVTGTDIRLRAIHTGNQLFIMAVFDDPTEDRQHKTMIWDDKQKRYQTGPKREDSFVIKWSMESNPIDLSLSAERPYRADIWYWKAFRTDHAGHADDKMDIYSLDPLPDHQKVLSKEGYVYYLVRPGDAGTPAYAPNLVESYQGDEVPKFRFQTPDGSRADVKAKGHWENGRWCIEFGRAFYTGNTDDLQFQRGTRNQFGISIYEIAGRPEDPTLDKPLFGSGEVGETLFLKIP
ncbi:MAG: hypothetical protein HQL82_03545 [Magnetococcales bacterium]|nr:hypothetical protein [Magnetococcales bacterium]